MLDLIFVPGNSSVPGGVALGYMAGDFNELATRGWTAKGRAEARRDLALVASCSPDMLI